MTFEWDIVLPNGTGLMLAFALDVSVDTAALACGVEAEQYMDWMERWAQAEGFTRGVYVDRKARRVMQRGSERRDGG